MWYLIGALIFFVLEMACALTINRAMSLQNDSRYYGILDDFEDLGVVAIAAAIGAVIWPLTLLIIVCFFIFNCFLEEPFNRLAKWLSDRL